MSIFQASTPHTHIGVSQIVTSHFCSVDSASFLFGFLSLGDPLVPKMRTLHMKFVKRHKRLLHSQILKKRRKRKEKKEEKTEMFTRVYFPAVKYIFWHILSTWSLICKLVRAFCECILINFRATCWSYATHAPILCTFYTF